MRKEMLLLVLPQSQHQHAHGDVDGRTEPTSYDVLYELWW